MGQTVATRTGVLVGTRLVRERDEASDVAPRHWIAQRPTFVCTLYGVLLGTAVCWPLLGGRPLFLLDWVFGPHTPLVPASAYGLDGGLTAGVIGSLATSALVHVVGEAATWLVLFAYFPVAAAGIGRLVGGPLLARLSAATVLCVNPWVFSRIYAGQLLVLMDLALLPFAVAAALRDREGSEAGGAIVCALWWAVLAALSPPFVWIFGIVVVVAAIAVALRRARTGSWWRAARSGALWLAGATVAVSAMSLYVLLPRRVTSLPVKVGSATLAIYATRGARDVGLFVNVAGLYGFWRGGVTLPKDVVTGWPFLLLALLVVAASGYWTTLRRRGGASRDRREIGWAVVACGVAGYFLALGAQGPTGRLFRWAYHDVPFFDILREPQKALVLTVLMYATGVGWAVKHLLEDRTTTTTTAKRPWATWAITIAAGVLLPLAYTPTVFDGLAGQISPSSIPSAYARASRLLGQGAGQVLYLPWHLYESLPFAGDRDVANLGPSIFSRPVISGDNVQAPGVETQSTSLRSRYLGQLVAGGYSHRAFGAQVAELGVEYVVLAKVADWRSYGWLAKQSDLRLVLRTRSLEVWRNLDFEGVGHRAGEQGHVTQISPVAYRIPRGRSGTVWLDAPYEPGWTVDGVPGTPTSDGTLRFVLRSQAGGVATFAPWSAAREGYEISGAAAALGAATALMLRYRRPRRRTG